MGKHRAGKAGQKLINGLWLHEDGAWRYRFMRRGRLYTGNTQTDDREEAEGFIAQLKAHLKQVERGLMGPQPPSAPVQATSTTLGALVDRWEATKINCSKSHRQSMAGSIRNHFACLLGTVVEEIATWDVNQAINTYTQSKGMNPGRGGKPCPRDHTANGANRLLERLRSLVSWGRKEGLVAKVGFQINKVKPDEPLKFTLRLRHVEKFFALVDRAKNPHLGMAVRLMVWTGLREAEVRHLSWNGVSWDRNLMFPDATKTADGEGVVMPAELRAYLWAHPNRKATGLILPSAWGSRAGAEACYQPGVTSLAIEAASWKIAFDELCEEDVQRVFSLIDALGNRDLSTLARFILYFGVPESHGRSIRWEHLCLEDGTYHWPVEGDLSRTISIPVGLLSWLKALSGQKQVGRVVCAPMGRHRGNGKFRYGAATRAIGRVWKDLRLPRLTPHRLRASFATIHAHSFKTHITVIQHLMRHKDVATTQKYIDVNDEERQEAQASWPHLGANGAPDPILTPSPED